MSFHRKPNVYVSKLNLKVLDLIRSLAFYQDILGFQILEKSEKRAILTADGKTALLEIEQPDDVIPKQPRTTGLYHFALLLPSRSDLGSVLKHLLKLKYPLQGGSDHLVSEALYLADPDGNGIELYVDRSPSQWKWNNGEVEMSTDPIDVDGLLAEGRSEWNKLPEDTIMGHIHLHVSELEKIKEFYCQGLGFEVVCNYGNQALFISSGGYHHHIGLNVWNGIGAPQPSEKSVGLIDYTIVYPNEKERDNASQRLQESGYNVAIEQEIYVTKDPSGNKIHLIVN
ncbi:glyoxalase [Bacillus sp. UMB0899]|uniref:VOC family protein n=1 Tax=Metabacillus schmidteae TaxID=2730405 RepID=UPI000C807785|nr:VOC family protein [Metabacillus schmidteae]PMC40212.1 glyoxalase [Bacillus sp. UMB0899]